MKRWKNGLGVHKRNVEIKKDSEQELYAYISLGKRKVTKIDVGDLELLEEHRFYPHKRNDGKYVARCSHCKRYLHRILLDSQKSEEVDHIDGDPLNNARSNLRPCSTRQNQIARSQSTICEGYYGIKQVREASERRNKRGKGITISHAIYSAIGSSKKYRTAFEAAREHDNMMLEAYRGKRTSNERFHNYAFVQWNTIEPEQYNEYREWLDEQENEASYECYKYLEENDLMEFNAEEA